MRSKLPDPAIPPVCLSSEPIVVRLGVTGHRHLSSSQRSAVNDAFRRVMRRLDELITAAHSYEVLSALAEGADRLVADFVLRWEVKRQPGKFPPRLKIILPMPEVAFFETFDVDRRAASIEEFQKLAALAEPPAIEPAPPPEGLRDPLAYFKNDAHRHDAFLKNGCAIADDCRILIAVWNGKKAAGQGGTADIVSYALSRGYSVIRIHPTSGKIIYPHHRDDFFSQMENLEEYNADAALGPGLTSKIDERFAKLTKQAGKAGISVDRLLPLVSGILPHWEKATRLAAKNRQYYLWTGTVAYFLAAFAVFYAAFFSLMCGYSHDYFYGEAGIIALVFVLGMFLKFAGWQRKWIDYRYLAERLRAACFLHVANLPLQPLQAHPDHQLPWLPDGWLSIAERELWKTVASSAVPSPADPRQETLEETQSLARFLLDSWVDAQAKYYEKASHRNHWWNELSEAVLIGFVVLTALIALGHARWGEALRSAGHDQLLAWMSILAVGLPAFGSAVAGVTVHWHFHRNYERYSGMSHFISQKALEIRRAVGLEPNPQNSQLGPEDLRDLLIEVDAAMAHEHEGWRTVFGVRLPGPG